MSDVVSDDDLNALAAEYVLGTLDYEERKGASALIEVDARFRGIVHVWERRFGELHLMVEAVAPDPQLWARIKPKAASVEQVSLAIPSRAEDLAGRTTAAATAVVTTPAASTAQEAGAAPTTEAASAQPAPETTPGSPTAESAPVVSPAEAAPVASAGETVPAAPTAETVPAAPTAETGPTAPTVETGPTAVATEAVSKPPDAASETETPPAEQGSAAETTAAAGDTPSGETKPKPDPVAETELKLAELAALLPVADGPERAASPAEQASDDSLAARAPEEIPRGFVPPAPMSTRGTPAIVEVPVRTSGGRGWMAATLALGLVAVVLAGLISAWRFFPERLPDSLRVYSVLDLLPPAPSPKERPKLPPFDE